MIPVCICHSVKSSIGDKARRFLDGEHELDANEIRTFRECCRKFWITGTKYAIKILPVDSQFLSSPSWLHPGVRDYSMLNQICIAANCLPQVIAEEERGQLEEEFMDFCTSDL